MLAERSLALKHASFLLAAQRVVTVHITRARVGNDIASDADQRRVREMERHRGRSMKSHAEILVGAVDAAQVFVIAAQLPIALAAHHEGIDVRLERSVSAPRTLELRPVV